MARAVSLSVRLQLGFLVDTAGLEKPADEISSMIALTLGYGLLLINHQPLTWWVYPMWRTMID